MSELWILVLLCLAMFIGSFMAGLVPLAVPFSETKLRLVSILGAGLLVGTALVIIIPEGVNALITNVETPNTATTMNIGLLRRNLRGIPPSDTPPSDDKAIGFLPLDKQPPIHHHPHGDTNNHPHNLLDADEDHHHDQQGGGADDDDHQHQSDNHMHSSMGTALVLGFVFMLVVDQLGTRYSHLPTSADSPPQNRHKITATLGLVVHAAADGIALGAAASTSQTRVEMIVFLAIMLHKAPAAFGLVSFLLHEGLDRNRIRRHLMVFSLAAPLTALFTYLGLGQSSKEVLTTNHVTGLTMLFSGGTFLYVATVHILPELAAQHTSTTFSTQQVSPILPGHHSPSTAGITIHHHPKGFSCVELTCLVAGCLLPLLLTFGHHH